MNCCRVYSKIREICNILKYCVERLFSSSSHLEDYNQRIKKLMESFLKELNGSGYARCIPSNDNFRGIIRYYIEENPDDALFLICRFCDKIEEFSRRHEYISQQLYDELSQFIHSQRI